MTSRQNLCHKQCLRIGPPHKFNEKSDSNRECSICNLEFEEGDVMWECELEHLFHASCLNTWCATKRSENGVGNCTCPNCRTRMTIMRSSNKKKKVLMTNMDIEVKIANTV